MSAIGRVATPRFIAASATAGAMRRIRRGSKGVRDQVVRTELEFLPA